MFAAPILFAWLQPYVEHVTDIRETRELDVAAIMDVIFILSLFILGGDFWDKLRSLFVHEAKVIFPAK